MYWSTLRYFRFPKISYFWYFRITLFCSTSGLYIERTLQSYFTFFHQCDIIFIMSQFCHECFCYNNTFLVLLEQHQFLIRSRCVPKLRYNYVVSWFVIARYFVLCNNYVFTTKCYFIVLSQANEYTLTVNLFY